MKKLLARIISDLQTPLTVVHGDSLQHPDEIVVCGMGGSGIVGTVLQELFPGIPVRTHRNFGIPRHVADNTLFLVVSYSGETEETLSSFVHATSHGAPTAVITGGGRLAAAAQKQQIPHVLVPHSAKRPSRFALGSLIRGALEILQQIQSIGAVNEFVRTLADTSLTTYIHQAEILANDMASRTLLVYSSPALAGLGLVWKSLINETAKQSAFANTIPEITHNEIESLDALEAPYLLIIADPQEDEERLRDRFSSVQTIAAEKAWPYHTLSLDHKERLVDLVYAYLLAAATSITLAEKTGVDPFNTPLIQRIKKSATTEE